MDPEFLKEGSQQGTQSLASPEGSTQLDENSSDTSQPANQNTSSPFGTSPTTTASTGLLAGKFELVKSLFSQDERDAIWNDNEEQDTYAHYELVNFREDLQVSRSETSSDRPRGVPDEAREGLFSREQRNAIWNLDDESDTLGNYEYVNSRESPLVLGMDTGTAQPGGFTDETAENVVKGFQRTATPDIAAWLQTLNPPLRPLREAPSTSSAVADAIAPKATGVDKQDTADPSAVAFLQTENQDNDQTGHPPSKKADSKDPEDPRDS